MTNKLDRDIHDRGLARETTLRTDYTGEQRLDRHARTIGFTLSFELAEVALARDRWRRLQLFAQKYQELMDCAGTPI